MFMMNYSFILMFSCFILTMVLLNLMSFNMYNTSDIMNFPMKWEINFLSKGFFLLIYFVSLIVFLWSFYYMEEKFKLLTFFVIFLSFVISMMFLSMSNSFLSVFIGWEGLGVSSFLLVVFYQNWSSSKGGLLTLLTNRLGDAILMLNFSIWLLSSSTSLTTNCSFLFILFFILLSLTKSAQWPFFSWLPAAMAAPTPVSSLVHSSTLVTAGIWLIIRWSPSNSSSVSSWVILGLSTALIASSAALLETDFKKIVALSTLSQLGLMYLSLSLSSFWCFFHMVTHALAKAALFTVIGTLLHKFYSEQDTRSLYGCDNNMLTLLILLSIFSLIGLTFNSGFFSKEMILSKSIYIFSSYINNMLMFIISSMTMMYCIKMILYFSTFAKIIFLLESKNKISIMMMISPSILIMLMIFFGSIFFNNNIVIINVVLSMLGWFWMIPLSGLFLATSNFSKNWIYLKFEWMSLMIVFFKKTIISIKKVALQEKYAEYMNNMLSLKSVYYLYQPSFITVTSIMMMLTFLLLHYSVNALEILTL